MTVIAEAVRHMLAAGMSHEAVVAAVESMELAQASNASTKGRPKSGAERTRAWRARKNVTAGDEETSRDVTKCDAASEGKVTNVTKNVTSHAVTASPLPRKEIPPGPPKETQPSPLSLSPYGDISLSSTKASKASLFDEDEGIETQPTILAKPNSDIDRAVSAWNEMADKTGLSTVTKLNDWRRKSVKARIATYGLAEWLRAVQMVGDSAHLHGQNRDQFCANFDFLVREQNFLRVIEGNYNRRQVSGRPTTGFDREPTAQQRNLASMLSAREAFVNGGRRAPDEHPGAGDDTVVSF